MRRTKKIGIFDSGFGGLHITRSIVRALPEYDYVYLGDSARAPYGDRSQETIYEFTQQGVEFLFAKGCDLVIIACNTASSEALRKIQQEYLPQHARDKRVLGVLIPAAEEAMSNHGGPIGVIATTGTVTSGAFLRELKKFDAGIKIHQQACALLVPMIEAGEEKSPEMHSLLKRYLQPLLRKHISTLILGCTHYGIIERKIKTIIGPHVRIISEARVVPKKLKDYLKRHPEIESRLSKRSTVRFFSTDTTDKFRILGSKLYGHPIKVERAVLG